ncbi:hypothetical protein [Dysgonomonas mossii]|uniref:hypothetical protein n=1 Tax=Dysgonomonas mossii TaxID=163665 RepID=UPI0039969A4A
MASYSKLLFDKEMYEEFIKYTDNKDFPFMTSIIKCDIGIFYWKTGNLKEAAEVFEEAYNMVPSKILPKYLLFSLYKESKNKKEAFEMANIILGCNIQVSGSIAIKARKEAKEYLDKYAINTN